MPSAVPSVGRDRASQTRPAAFVHNIVDDLVHSLPRRWWRSSCEAPAVTPDEALRQVGELLRGLGAEEPAGLPVRAMIGAAIVELAHVGPVLAVSALVYRFRAAPRPGLV